MNKYLRMLVCGSACLCLPQFLFAHSAIINNEAWLVCENQTRSDACEFTDNHDSIYRGTCQLMSEKLLCVRNQPIEKADSDAAHP